ncbi:MAG: ATP-binding protein [Candidatus Aenigmarchaeota archaeon]|nr:ATP-binding protein [Candidatus Aenigmarchaeota archaeon]
MKYFERKIAKKIKKVLDRREIICIRGPRQAGKTTLLNIIAKELQRKGIKEENIIYITFEDVDNLEKFSTNPKAFLRSFTNKEKTYFLMDEYQYLKDGKKLKMLYDLFENTKFFITGSSSLELTSKLAKYLVGRIFFFELYTFDFYEFLHAKNKKLWEAYIERHKLVSDLIRNKKEVKIDKKDIFINDLLSYFEEFIIFGGYPEVIKTDDKEMKKIILKNIFETYLAKEIKYLLNIKDSLKFKKILTFLAASNGNIINYNDISCLFSSYYKEVLEVLEIFEQTYLIKTLRPYHRNMRTELRKNPKIYFFDTGLRNYMINNFNSLNLREDAGILAENFVFRQLFNFDKINYWRTTSKAEVDFIISDIPVEVKFSEIKKPKISRSFRSFIKTYKPKVGIVFTKNLWAMEKMDESIIYFIPLVYA